MIPNLSALASSQPSNKLIQPNLKILTNCIQRTDGNIGGGCFDSPDVNTGIIVEFHLR